MAGGAAQRPSTPAAGIEGGVDPSIVDTRPMSPVSDMEQLKRDVVSLKKKNADLKTTMDYYNLITMIVAFIVAMGAVPVILEENGMPEWSEVFKTLAKQAVADEVLYFTFFYLLVKTFVPKNVPVSKSFIALYNLSMMLFSLITFVLMVYTIHQMYYGPNAKGLWSDDCTYAFSHEVWGIKMFRRISEFFYWSKFVEYMDTMFLIMKGKEVSILQSFHHLGAPWDLWVFILYENEATWIFTLFNSLIHTVMYGYYGLTAVKIPVPKVIKGSITSLQILQFVTGFTLVWPYKNIPCFGSNRFLMFGFYFNYFYVGTVLLLFLNFYYHNYIARPPRAGAAKQRKD